jgi:hypothetical protein
LGVTLATDLTTNTIQKDEERKMQELLNRPNQQKMPAGVIQEKSGVFVIAGSSWTWVRLAVIAQAMSVPLEQAWRNHVDNWKERSDCAITADEANCAVDNEGQYKLRTFDPGTKLTPSQLATVLVPATCALRTLRGRLRPKLREFFPILDALR